MGDLLARRRERQRAQGVPVSAVRSTFIAGVGYDQATGTMAVAMTGGRLYGYQVPPEVHRAVAESTSPGGAYNRLVKGTGRAGIARCPMCGRFYPDTARHACPVRHTDRPTTTRNNLARDAAAALSRLPRPDGNHGAPPVGPRPATPHPAPPADAAHPGPPVRPLPAVAAVVDPYPSSSTVNPAGRHHPRPVHPRLPNVAAFTALSKVPDGQRVSNRPHAGWTASERVAAAVTRHASSHYVPDRYGQRSTNGHGIVHFAGAGAGFARGTYPDYPPGALNTRQGNSPTLRHLLAASTRNPGRVELGGYAVSPHRGDERIVADRVYLFTDAATGTDAWRQAQDDYGILGAAAPPDDIRLVDVPRRPGEKAWLLAWE